MAASDRGESRVVNWPARHADEVAAFLYKAYATSEELTRLEEFRLSRNLFQRFRHGDIAHFQYERGVIDESRLRSSLNVLMLGHPRVQAFWSDARGSFVEPYQDYVDRLIAESRASPAPE